MKTFWNGRWRSNLLDLAAPASMDRAETVIPSYQYTSLLARSCCSKRFNKGL